jgi:hypothetical protein
MAIDQRDVSSKLRFMDDRALQQYAAMHKNDPYIFPLAFQESQNRQKLRMQQQAQAGAQPQPKVADQALAQMMPEEQGIATLPAQNMQGMADGGIAGYEGYDEAPQQFGQEPVLRMAEGGHVQGYSGAAGSLVKAGPDFVRFLQGMGIDYTEFSRLGAADKAALTDMFEQSKSAAPATTPAAQKAAQTGSKAFEAGKAARPYLDKAGKVVKAGAVPVVGAGLSAAQGLSEIDSAQKFYDDPNVPLLEKGKQALRTGANVALPYIGGAIGSGVAPVAGTVGGAALGTGLAALIDDEGEALKKYRAKNEPAKGPTAAQNRSVLNKADAAIFATPGTDNAPAAEKTDTKADTRATPSSVLSSSTLAKTSGGRGGPSAGAASSGLRDEKGIASLYGNLLKSQEYVDPAKGDVDKLAQDQLAAATKRKQEYEAFVAKQGDVYKDRSDRLVEREKGIGKQVDQNMGLALLNAGLAIMSTPGSLATAIGKGAQVGTAQFAAGLDKINLARDRLADAKDKLEDLRMNRDELTFKQRSALEAEIDKAKIDARKMSIDGIRAAAGVTEKRAETLLNQVLATEKTRFEQSEMTKRTLATINASNDGRTKQLWAGLMQKHGNDPVAAAKEYNTIETGDKTNIAAEKLVQDRVGEWEKANKLRLSLMKPAEQAAELRSAEKRLRNDIYTQLKLTPTMGAGASGNSGFKFLGVESQ